MLQIYADESGTHHPKGQAPGSEVPVVSGYMGNRDNWRKFENDWKVVLDNYKVAHFHAKEFERGKVEPYLSWSDEKRESFRYALAEIAGRFIPVGGGYHIKEHHRENPGDQDYPYRLPIAYFFIDLGNSLQEWGLSSEKISIIFDETTNKAWMAEIAGQIETMKASGLKIESHTFGDDKFYIPLQAADMLSHRTRQRHFEKLERQAATGQQFYLPATVYDIVLCRNLHPRIGFNPKLTPE
jgi:hypothetical protein